MDSVKYIESQWLVFRMVRGMTKRDGYFTGGVSLLLFYFNATHQIRQSVSKSDVNQN